MTWSNLLSGLIGAGLGGLLAIVASVITMRQQRSLALAAAAEEQRQARLRLSYSASAEILSNMLTIKGVIYDIKEGRFLNEWVRTVLTAAERILIVYNPQIADDNLRSRIADLMDVVEQWYQITDQWPGAPIQERFYLILSYMEYVNMSIRAHLDNQPLPPVESPPDLLALEHPAANADQPNETHKVPPNHDGGQ